MKYKKTLILAAMATLITCLSYAGSASVVSNGSGEDFQGLSVPTGGVDGYVNASGSNAYALVYGNHHSIEVYNGTDSFSDDRAGYYILVADASYGSYAYASISW